MNLQNQLDYYPQLLDGVRVPEELDADLVKSEIMLQCGLLTPLYSEPATMAAAIKQWFDVREWTFQHLVNIIKAEYSPIENTDRYDHQERTISGQEQSAGTETGSETRTGSGSDTRANSGSRREDLRETGNTESKVSAYNASEYSPSGNETGETTRSTTGGEAFQETTTRNDNSGVTSDLRRADARTHGSKDIFEQHLHGNIGVTTNQEMINQELALLKDFNIYQWIAINLRSTLFLEVY